MVSEASRQPLLVALQVSRLALPPSFSQGALSTVRDGAGERGSRRAAVTWSRREGKGAVGKVL